MSFVHDNSPHCAGVELGESVLLKESLVCGNRPDTVIG